MDSSIFQNPAFANMSPEKMQFLLSFAGQSKPTNTKDIMPYLLANIKPRFYKTGSPADLRTVVQRSPGRGTKACPKADGAFCNKVTNPVDRSVSSKFFLSGKGLCLSRLCLPDIFPRLIQT